MNLILPIPLNSYLANSWMLKHCAGEPNLKSNHLLSNISITVNSGISIYLSFLLTLHQTPTARNRSCSFITVNMNYWFFFLLAYYCYTGVPRYFRIHRTLQILNSSLITQGLLKLLVSSLVC